MVSIVTYTLNSVLGESQGNFASTIRDQQSPFVQAVNDGGYIISYRTVGTSDFFFTDYYHPDHSVQNFPSLPHQGLFDAQGQLAYAQLQGSNNSIGVWTEGAAGDGAGIYGRFFGVDGGGLGNEFLISSGSGRANPHVSALGVNGLAGVVYENNGAVDLSLVTQSNVSTLTISATNASQPQIANFSNANQFCVVWIEDVSGTPALFSRVYDNGGVAQTGSPVLVDSFGAKGNPSLIGMSNGNYAVVYEDSGYIDEGGTTAITLRILAQADGTSLFGPIKVNTTSTALNEVDPDVNVLGNGFVIVTWTVPNSAMGNDIYGRIFDHTGIPISIDGSSDPFIITNSGDDDQQSSVDGIRWGEFITVWQDSDTSDNSDGRISRQVSELVRTTTGDNTGETLEGDALKDRIFGNGGNDILRGFTGDDFLDGGAGGDTMEGGHNDDTYVVDSIFDIVTELAGQGTDTVQSGLTWTLSTNVENLMLTGNAAIDGTGNSEDNEITGNSGSNRLDGGSGTDTLTGGAGNDTYIVNDSTVTVSETQAGDGHDTIVTSVFYDIPNLVEDLTMIGSANIRTNGNDLANRIEGNVADNYINGGAGTDIMVGGPGNDTYTIDNLNDVIIELAGGGDDAVYSFNDAALSGNIETLILASTASNAISGFGDGNINQIFGNEFDNVLYGRGNIDRLGGGAGDDIFVMAMGDQSASQQEQITDFEGAGVVGGDRMGFGGFGPGATVVQVSANSYEVRDANNVAQASFILEGVTTALIADDYYFN